MWPGLQPEREAALRGREQGRVQAIGAADQKAEPPHAAIAQKRDLVGEGPGGSRRPVFVAGDHVRIREVCFQGFGLGGLAGLAGFDLDDLHRPQAKGSPGGPPVIIGQVNPGPAGQVTQRSIIGAERIVDRLSGEQLPRIC